MLTRNLFHSILISLLLLAPVKTVSAGSVLHKAVTDAFKEDVRALDAMNQDFLKLLREHKFDSLNSEVELLQFRYETGENEWAVISTFEQFRSDEPGDASHFDEWVKHSKGKWTAHLGRGIYHVGMGWKQRGGKFFRETPKENIRKMKRSFSLGKKDLRIAIENKPLTIVAYKMLLQVANALGHDEDENRLIEDVLAIAPDTYYLRWQYLWGMQPKWGGSYPIIRTFAKDAQKERKKNPRLYALSGFEDAIKAERFKRDKKYKKAVKYYTKALRYAPVSRWLRGRGWCYKKLKKYDEQIADMNTLLSIAPADAAALGRRGYAYVKKKDYKLAKQDLQRSLELDEKRSYVSNNLGWISFKDGDLQKSSDYFDITLKHEPENMYALRYCGHNATVRAQYTKADTCLSKAVKVDPENAEAWRLYGELLHVQGKPGDKKALANYLEYADRKKEKKMYKKVRDYLVRNNYPLPDNAR